MPMRGKDRAEGRMNRSRRQSVADGPAIGRIGSKARNVAPPKSLLRLAHWVKRGCGGLGSLQTALDMRCSDVQLISPRPYTAFGSPDAFGIVAPKGRDSLAYRTFDLYGLPDRRSRTDT